MSLRILDLFCCQGGAARGYADAGFQVYGVDRTRQPRYPYAFHFGDAIEVLRTLLIGGTIIFRYPDGTIERLELGDFHAIHASPPCQAYSIATAGNLPARSKYDRLIAATRDLLQRTGRPWAIENVEGARRELIDPVRLCWSHFFEPGSVLDEDGTPLRMQRHRYFETSPDVTLAPPRACRHPRMQVAGSYGGARRDKVEAREVRHGGYVPSKAVQEQLLGIDWMTEKGL